MDFFFNLIMSAYAFHFYIYVHYKLASKVLNALCVCITLFARIYIYILHDIEEKIHFNETKSIITSQIFILLFAYNIYFNWSLLESYGH